MNENLYSEVEEYFRKNFRKVDFEDAKDIVIHLGKAKAPVRGLEDKFWVWETLEEATRPHVSKL